MEDNPLRTLCFYIILVVGAFVMVDCAGGESRVLQAQVVDRAYMPSHYDSNGDYVSEKYEVIVDSWDGVVKVDTDANGYYRVKPGQTISYRVRTGWITHHDWDPRY